LTLMMLEELFQLMTRHWQLLTGAVIVVVALYLPAGLAGLWSRLFASGSSVSEAASSTERRGV
jgi:ABC-type branched-subunit amino acid transport system permease subunit